MAFEHTAACTMAFPPEIWRIVLRSFGTQPQDLVELWTGCRGVSRHFKHEVEELCIADYLTRTRLQFEMTTTQRFDGNSRIQFHDHHVHTEYNRISVDRAGAIFQAKDDDKAKLLKQMHNGADFPGPSHLVDFSRPFDGVALPGVFFHANGDVEVGWRELFAAILAELKYYYRTGWILLKLPSCTLSARESRHLLLLERSREAEMFESNMSKATQAEAPRARVFRMVVSRFWIETET